MSTSGDERVPVLGAVDGGTAKLLPDMDRGRAWLLTLDGAPQSYVDLDDPAHLEFEYVRRLGHVVDLHGGPGAEGTPLSVVHLGGGALTLPRYTAATRPGSRQDVVEYDGALIDLVREHLPLPPGSGITVHHADARQWTATAQAGRADLVVADVFGGNRVPAHLTTVEYARAAQRLLRPGGLYAANIADGAPFDFLRSQLGTLGEVFDDLAVIAEAGVLRGRRFGNAVLLASHTPLDVRELARRCAADPFPARVEHGTALAGLRAGARPVHDGTAVDSPRPPEGTFSVG